MGVRRRWCSRGPSRPRGRAPNRERSRRCASRWRSAVKNPDTWRPTSSCRPGGRARRRPPAPTSSRRRRSLAAGVSAPRTLDRWGPTQARKAVREGARVGASGSSSFREGGRARSVSHPGVAVRHPRRRGPLERIHPRLPVLRYSGARAPVLREAGLDLRVPRVEPRLQQSKLALGRAAAPAEKRNAVLDSSRWARTHSHAVPAPRGSEHAHYVARERAFGGACRRARSATDRRRTRSRRAAPRAAAAARPRRPAERARARARARRTRKRRRGARAPTRRGA